MANKITIGDLSKAVNDILSDYNNNYSDKLFKATKKTMTKFVKITKEKAPYNYNRKNEPLHFKDFISSKTTKAGKNSNVTKGVWYVKDPEYRITHLLVNGHQNRDGTRTKGNDFLKNATNEIAKEYIDNVEKAFK